MEASSTTITWRVVRPPALPEVGQDLGQRGAGDAGPPLEVGRRPGRHGCADDLRKPACLPPDPGGPEHGRLAGSGLADHQVVAVARGEELPHALGLLAVQVAVVCEDLVDRARAHLCRIPAPIAPVAEVTIRSSAARSSVVVYRRSPLVTGTTCAAGSGCARCRLPMSRPVSRIGQDPDHAPARSRNLAGQATASSGVTSNALATAADGIPSGEARSEQGDGHHPGPTPLFGETLLVDLPVIEGHPLLAGQDPEDLLDLLRHPVSRFASRSKAAVRSSTVAGRCAVLCRPAARSRPVAPIHLSRKTSIAAAVGAWLAGWRAPPGSAASGEVAPGPPSPPRSPPGAVEKARRMAFGMSGDLTQAIASDLPGEAQRRQLGPQGRPVEGAGGHLPGVEVSAVGSRPPAVCGPAPGWGRPRGCGAGGPRPGWSGAGRRRR